MLFILHSPGELSCFEIVLSLHKAGSYDKRDGFWNTNILKLRIVTSNSDSVTTNSEVDWYGNSFLGSFNWQEVLNNMDTRVAFFCLKLLSKIGLWFQFMV